MTILDIQNVSKHFKEHHALDRVSFEVPSGCIFGLLGPNGAGKTTLIRIINQITAPDEGQILFKGEKLSKQHISNIGYLPEERGLYKKMSVYDQLIYFARLRGLSPSKARKTINAWLEKFEATTWKKKKVEELSKGMQQKIQFIATVMHEPEFIILDEPFTGFDPKNTQLIKNEIENLKQRGTTIMLSTHRMENVEEICDEVVLLNRSKVVTSGTVGSIRNSLKDNTYHIRFKGQLPNPFDAIQIVQHEEQEGLHELTFRYGENQEGLRLFQDLPLEILEYREIIPGMQEVFLTLTATDNE